MSIHGPARLIVAMVTPFGPDGEVDLSTAARLSEEIVASGADGILVSGTTGEAPTLTVEEKLCLLEAVLDSVGDDAEIWMGSGTNDTRSSVQLTREAEDVGAHGVMLVTPYYNKPPQDGLYEHFRAAAESCDLPVMIYNVPSRTGVNIEAETVARLAELENVAAVKEASGDVDQAAHIRRLAGDDLLVYSGDDSMTIPLMSVGGWGVVSVAGHLVAAEMREMITAFVRGEVARAAELHCRLLPLFEALFISTNPIPVKTALSMAGRDVGGFRLPLAGLQEHHADCLHRVLRSLDLVD